MLAEILDEDGDLPTYDLDGIGGAELRACEVMTVREDGSCWARNRWTGEEREMFARGRV